MDRWTLQDAKNKFSQVVETAMSHNRPQVITRRGKDSAVLLSFEAYQELVRPQRTLLESLLPEEPIGVELDIVRGRVCGQDVGR